MIVVSDTTPLSELAKIGRLDILKDIYGEILIPKEVYDEVTTGNHPAAELIKATAWVQIRSIENVHLFDQLRRMTRLGKGECAAMVLTEELDADQLRMDDLDARRVALSRSLPVIGTIGTLILAKQQGLIDSVKDVLDELRRSGKWINPRLYQEVLEIVDEVE